jgi:hypothetical protein
MNTEQSELLNSINQQVDILWKTCKYITNLNDSITLNGFLLSDENAYIEYLNNSTIQKSNLITLLSKDNNFSFWNTNTTEKYQAILCYLAYSNQLNITSQDTQRLTQSKNQLNKYVINSEYEPIVATNLIKKIQEQFYNLNLEQNQVKKRALKVILANDKHWDQKQNLANILYNAFGNSYDDIWQKFKLS